MADDHHDGDDDNGDDIDNEDNDTDGDDDGDKDDDDNDASQPALVLFFLLCAFCKEISLGTRHQTNHDDDDDDDNGDDDNGEKIMSELLNKKSRSQNPVWRPVWSGLPSHLADDVGQRHDVVLRQGQRLDLRQLPGLMHMGDYLPEVLMECR